MATRLARTIRRIAAYILCMLLVPVAIFWIVLTQPSCTAKEVSLMKVEPTRLEQHVRTLSETCYPRDYTHRDNLDACADYILEHFGKAGARTLDDVFKVGPVPYRNIIGRFGPAEGPRVIVGAHYDACGPTPGADDNASGVAGLIELAYLLGRAELQSPVEVAAFALEEPPFFFSDDMGSARYVEELKEKKVDVSAMLCLEMIGFFSDDEGSQSFPFALLRLFYPSRANFISVIGCMNQRSLVQSVKKSMSGATPLPVHSFCGPRFIPGVDFSDHINFWDEGYPAVMITDTAFHRNPAYHGAGDVAEELDYERMAMVVLGVFEAVRDLAENKPLAD